MRRLDNSHNTNIYFGAFEWQRRRVWRRGGNMRPRVGNTKHENLVFCVYRYEHGDFKLKHKTNTKKIENSIEH